MRNTCCCNGGKGTRRNRLERRGLGYYAIQKKATEKKGEYEKKGRKESVMVDWGEKCSRKERFLQGRVGRKELYGGGKDF